MKTMAILNSPTDGTLMDSIDLHAQAYVTSDKLLDGFFFWGGGEQSRLDLQLTI